MPSVFPDHLNFADQRARFLGAATAAGARLTHYPHPLKGPFGEDLGTDVAVLGDPAAKRLLVLLSGTHGVEGYYGSQCQAKWLSMLAGCSALPEDVAVVVIHLINPWGTAWLRRVNEDNIDLNRNQLNFAAALPDNQAYAALHGIYDFAELRGPQRQRADDLLAEHGDEQRQVAILAHGDVQTGLGALNQLDAGLTALEQFRCRQRVSKLVRLMRHAVGIEGGKQVLPFVPFERLHQQGNG